MAMNIVTGNDGANVLAGGNGDDLIYGFDPNAAYASATIAATRVASGLDQPLYVTAPPGDTSRLFIVEKSGTIKILDLNSGQVLATPFLTVPVNIASERGLLGLAFDPDYASNGRSTSTARRPPGAAQRGAGATRCRAIPTSRRPAASSCSTSAPRPTAITMPAGSVSGRTAISTSRPARSAYRPMRRTTPTCSARCCASMSSRSGPATRSRPTIRSSAMGGGVREEIFAFGLRNPWRASFDSATGNFFIGNVGAASFEEINLGEKGANYGWPIVEGMPTIRAFINPIFTYPHGSGASVTGGYVYRGESDGLQRPVFLRRLRPEHDFHAAVRRRQLGRDRSHRADRAQCRHGQFAGLVRRGRARQSLRRRYRRRGFPADARAWRRPMWATRCRAAAATTGCSAAPATICSTAAPARTSSMAAPATIASSTRPGYGADMIFGFAAGAGSEDRINVSAFPGITSFADVLAARDAGRRRHGDQFRRRRHAHACATCSAAA